MGIKNLDSWTPQNEWSGYYRYVIGAKCAYEIILSNHKPEEDIYSAIGNLYLVGLWQRSGLLRELLGEDLTVSELLVLAEKDFKENMQ